MNQRLVKAYFSQGVHYFSDSKDELLPIQGMNPRHAANAARRLLLDADVWAKSAGMDQRPAQVAEHAPLWLSRTPLYIALVTQAGF